MKHEDRQRLEYRVYVVGGGFQYIQMFYEAGFLGSRSVGDADIICFTGGEDVDPQLYGEPALNTTNFNSFRDQKEMDIFAEAAIAEKPMVGICRGGQFLNVMNGGKMWQHVNNHTRSHTIVDVRSGKTIPGMTSTHHQMMIPGNDAEVLALANECTFKQSYGQIFELKKPLEDDVESLWYPKSLSLCFQPHPEFSPGTCRNYFMSLVDDFILTSVKGN
jgi:hypothetical protein